MKCFKITFPEAITVNSEQILEVKYNVELDENSEVVSISLISAEVVPKVSSVE